jgi:hypothetical protein
MTRQTVGLGQGVYYLASGIWPLISLRTFERVTGPKTDDWLVRTVGVLAAAVGGVLAARSLGAGGTAGPDPALGVATAVAFGTVDAVYGGTGRISKVYLADAAVQLLIVAAWLRAMGRDRAPG